MVMHLASLGAGGGGAAPTTLLNDTFTDSDGETLPNHHPAPTDPPGGAYTDWVAGLKVQGNKAQATASACASYIDSGQANITVTVTANTHWPGSGSHGDMLVLVRMQDTSNLWWYRWDPTLALLKITEKLAGTVTDRASGSLVSPDESVDHTMQVICSGSNISATFDGGHSLSYGSATDLQSATIVGLFVGAFSAGGSRETFDNLVVTNP